MLCLFTYSLGRSICLKLPLVNIILSTTENLSSAGIQMTISYGILTLTIHYMHIPIGVDILASVSTQNATSTKMKGKKVNERF